MKKLILYLMITLLSISFVNAVTLDNAVLYYSFDEDNVSGSTMIDLSSSGNNGNCVMDSNCNTVLGLLNNASNFDGINDYITVSDGVVTDNVFSFSAWIRPDTSTADMGIYTDYNTGSPYQGWGIFHRNSVGDKLAFYDSSSWYSSTTTLVDDATYHILITVSGTTLKMYINGSLDSTHTIGTITHYSTPNNIGADTTGSQNFDGTIDELAIYDRTLNTTEIDTLYNGGNGYNPYSVTPTPTPTITIDDISLVNNSYHNSNIDIQLNLSVTDTNSNVNSSYILFKTFNNPLYNGDNISQSSITPFYTDSGVTRDQFCIEEGFDSASAYTTSSYNSPAYYYTGTIWALTTLNANKYDSITCEKETQFGTNTLQPSSSIDISSLIDDTYNVKFVTENNETQTNSSTYTFTIDTTKPSTNIITNQTEFNTFQINMSNIFNYSDTNIDTCEIYLTELENVSSIDTDTFNCNTLYNFSTAGLHNLRINATDLAGNYNDTTQLNITINPYLYIYFNDTSNSTLLTTYDLTIYHPDGRETTPTIQANGSILLSPVNNGELDLGVHTLEFSRLGYATENFTYNVTDSAAGANVVFDVTRSKIILSIYDRETLSLITGTTSTVTLIATYGYNTTTTTGLVNITDVNFLAEDYQVIVENNAYVTESVYFTYNNQENLNVDVFMLSNSSTDYGTITVKAVATTGELISGAVCKALEWRPATSSFVAVGQGLTDSKGETILNIELGTKLYKFSCTKDSITAISSQQIIQTTGTSLTIVMGIPQLEISAVLSNMAYSCTNESYSGTFDRVTFTWDDTDGLVNEGCINIYNVVGTSKTLLNSSCVSSSTSQTQLITDTNNSFTKKVECVVSTSNAQITVDSITYDSNISLASGLKEYGLDILIPIIAIILGIVFGISIKPQNIYISEIAVFILIWLSVAIVPSVVSTTLALFVSMVIGIMLWGGYKTK